jgi:hypothetical protein
MNSARVCCTVGALATALAVGACGGGGSGAQQGPSDAGGSTTETAASAAIPQPSVSGLNRITRRRLAPASARVDLEMPSFSEPTDITNPLFPIGRLSAVILGEVEGTPLKVETTLLPETKTVEWNGRRIEALQSQFLAFLDGRITESAVDLYAQADDGSVWYLGEDVVDYENGVAATTDGTWLVGVDGPGALIMPARPRVGDVYRTENIPGVAFEQVTVKTVGKTVDGPSGPVRGAMIGLELHQDERRLEPKTFAPGYGEFFSGAAHDFEANALSVPADALPGPPPAELVEALQGAYEAFDAARAGDWSATSRAARAIAGAWDAYRTPQTPERLGARMSRAVAALERTIGAREREHAANAALDVVDATIDFELRHRSPVEVNAARLELWAHQLLIDAEAGNAEGVSGDVTTLEFVRDRLPLGVADGNRIDDQLRYLRAVADAGELGVAADEAARMIATLRTTS